MKISIGSQIVNGPWGGGNLFVINLSKYLIELGHEVVYDLSSDNIDLILLTDPRSRSESSSTFNHIDINKYKKYIKPDVAVVQRINECDERKNTSNINKFYLEASNCADSVVFVSKWLEDIYLNLGMEKNKSKVIMSGSDKNIFKKYPKIRNNKKINIVTHHWSSHENKGFETYKFLDSLLNKEKWKGVINFSYIGNVSKDYNLPNTNIFEPLSGQELAKKISDNDIYLTGSINEPSGNHHIEASLCGLPVLYLESGGVPEYCQGYGVSYKSVSEFESKLEEIIAKKDFFVKNLDSYPFNSIRMCQEYLELFINLIEINKSKKQLKKHYLNRFYLMKFKLSKYTRSSFKNNLKNRIKELVKR